MKKQIKMKKKKIKKRKKTKKSKIRLTRKNKLFWKYFPHNFSEFNK